MAKKKTDASQNTGADNGVTSSYKNDTGSGKNTGRSGAGNGNKALPAPKRAKTPGDPDSFSAQIVSVIFWVLAFLLSVFFIANIWEDAGVLIEWCCTLLYGLFGYGALFVVVSLALIGYEWRNSVLRRNALFKFAFAFAMTVIISAVIHIVLIMNGALPLPTFPEVFFPARYWYSDRVIVGGGVFGGIIGGLFYILMHGWVSLLVLCAAFLVCLVCFFELTPRKVARGIKNIAHGIAVYSASKKEDRAVRAAERQERERIAREAAQKAEKERAEKERAEKEREEQKKRAAAQEDDYPDSVQNGYEKADQSLRGSGKARNIDFSFARSDAQPENGYNGGADRASDAGKDAENEVGGKSASGSVESDKPELPNIEYFDENRAEREEKTAAAYDFEDSIPGPSEESRRSFDRLGNVEFGFDDDDIPEDGLTDMDSAEDIAAAAGATGIAAAAASTGSDDDSDDSDDVTDDSAPSGTGAGQADDSGKSEYIFPPIELLSPPVGNVEHESREEQMKTARKLVEVLRSFKVETEIVNISCGPTVTRYELAPKAGVRVRAIANLVDDIALNLEATGVRIEVPIPGKTAVGIEVPNKNRATVTLREMIDTDQFRNSKSKLTTCIGADVSGEPIFADIAKMPHLLIAGTTGSGKSICLHSIIVSLLYKASPDELKFILIDPKKVEFNLYNKLPHLLIPVVNNPKKAAGALATAVNEMERRFELIESAGVRDIKGYNKVAAMDPSKEFLPYIVIVIDELADLMLTAKDTVEDSICRIAQKARAAGIHLILSTQRPSTDVITGLIKSNVPSRIALSVSSSINSRIIIDCSGAEKLIGYGDMLFAPVGSMKPQRAQGAYIDDSKEVKAVTDFIKAQFTGDIKYDDSFLSQIDIEAEKCGQSKKKLSSDELDSGDELDPKFYEAVEVALDMGKISTSLLQRRLGLGYGRAAKIIDRMQEMQLISPPDGQKPRNILISKQDYQEMMMKKEDE